MTTKHTPPTLIAACAMLCLAILPVSAATYGKFTYTDDGTSITITDYPTTATGAVTIPAAIGGKPVTSIGGATFFGCTGLTSVKIPSTVSSVGASAFGYCSGLTSVTIPDGVTSIGSSTFDSCSGLTSVAIPAGVTSIGEGAFRDCIGLTSVTIPSSVTSIGYGAFDSCSGLTSVTVPSGINSVGSAFDSCSGVTTVTISAGVNRSILEGTLNGFTNLTSVTISPGVTTIGGHSFAVCSGLTSVTIPASVTRIENDAFFRCSGLQSMTIPASVTNLGSSAFAGCSSLTAITVDPTNPNYSSLSGVVFTKARHVLLIYPEGRQGRYMIPASVTSIGDRAFRNCIGLTSVTIPSSVTSIGNEAFYVCYGLTSVTIPPSVTSIGYSAFDSCVGLTSMTIPSSVTNIGFAAFRDCRSLGNAMFLGNAPTMGTYVFASTAPGFTIHYITGNTGFTSPKWKGYPCIGVAATPEIDIQQPVGTSLVDGSSKKSFGTVVVGQSGTAKTFTLKNTGTGDLSGLAVSKDGANAGNFIITPPAKTMLTPGESTSFKVTFKPTASGTRSATIHVQSNDSNENLFDIKLAGTGAL